MFYRDIALDDAELKFDAGKAGLFEGYASTFGGVDEYNDTIVAGAYKDTLARKKPMMFYGHNPGRVIGKWLHLTEDSKGLHVVGELTPGNSDAQDVYASMKHGALSGMSIGFRVPKGGAEEKDGRRFLKKIDLIEVSVVSLPADHSAQVNSVKSSIDTISKLSDCEDLLREAANFSKSDAVAFIARIKAVAQGEPEELAALKRKHADTVAQLIAARAELLAARFPIPQSLRGY